MPLHVKKPILDQPSDLTSTPVGQCVPSLGSRCEQADDVDSDDFDPDLESAYVAQMDVEESEDDSLEDDALFAMASMVARGARAPVEHGRRLETSRFEGGIMSRNTLSLRSITTRGRPYSLPYFRSLPCNPLR